MSRSAPFPVLLLEAPEDDGDGIRGVLAHELHHLLPVLAVDALDRPVVDRRQRHVLRHGTVRFCIGITEATDPVAWCVECGSHYLLPVSA